MIFKNPATAAAAATEDKNITRLKKWLLAQEIRRTTDSTTYRQNLQHDSRYNTEIGGQARC